MALARGACALAITSVFAGALAPAPARACSTGEPLEVLVHETAPAEGDMGVPTDAPVAIFGTSNLEDELMVEVSDAGGVVAGALSSVGQRHFWRPDAPLTPNTEYSVYLWTEVEGLAQQVDELFIFTTGEGPADPTPAPAVEIALSKWEKKTTECVEPPEPGSCDDCGKEEVIAVEERMRLKVTFPHPEGPFGRFYTARIRHGASAADVADGVAHESEWWGDGESPVTVSDDLGPVGSWEGEEVCVRAWVWDPRELDSESTITCAPIGEVNIPTPSGETDTGTSDGGTTDDGMSDGGMSDGGGTDGDGTGSGADEESLEGCGCRSAQGGGLGFGLAGLLLAFVVRRRRW